MNSTTRNNIIPALQGYFATQPIAKAWLFAYSAPYPFTFQGFFKSL